MSYPNNKIDFGKIIRESNRKDKENWARIMQDIKNCNKKNMKTWEEIKERCRKYNKNEMELVREAFEKIRKDNEKKYNKIFDLNIPKNERIAILFEYIINKLLMALTGHVDTLHEPIKKKRKKQG